MYDKEECLIKQINSLITEYKQLQEDKELLQYIIMHQSNKKDRIKELIKNGTARSN
jgi:UDP-glucose 6-dehydrogenase